MEESTERSIEEFEKRVSSWPVKVYPDGKTGSYCCTCKECKLYFIGHKWDRFCGDCSKNPGEELKQIGDKE